MGKAWLWAADEGGCGWYRTVIVAEALRARGHDVGRGISFDGEYADCEAVLGQRICVAGSTNAWSRWNFNQDKTTLFDADDDYFHMHQHPEFGKSAVEYSQSRTQARLLANAASSTYTTCASAPIAELFNVFCDNVIVVPNGLPQRYLDVAAPYERDAVRPGYAEMRRPIVGWAGSSFTVHELTSRVMDQLTSVEDWGGQLHTVGVPFSHARKIGLARPGVSITGWVDGSAKYLDTIDFDIWVAPYRQTDYNNAKVPTKALEAAFLGIPIVASDTTPYRSFVKHGVTGYLVPPGGDWEEPIRTLIEHPELRAQMGAAAREIAKEYTIENLAANLWEPLMFGDR